MSAHDFDNKGARVGGRGGRDAVDSVADAVEGGGCACSSIRSIKYLGEYEIGLRAPMVMSVPAMSLSILPTSPTMLRCLYVSYWS